MGGRAPSPRSNTSAYEFNSAVLIDGMSPSDTTGPMPARLTLPAPLADKMMALAARTYVPETEASRLSGAGAGLTDND